MTTASSPSHESVAADRAIDLRSRLRSVGDQGRRGTCVAFAVTAIHEADRGFLEPAHEPDDLAEEVLFWGAKQIDGDNTGGTRFTSANLALQRWGQPAEVLWPYDDTRDHRASTYQPPSPAVDPANCEFTELRPLAVDLAGFVRELEAGRAIAMGIPVWEDLRQAESEPLPAPTAAETFPTRHAVVVVGVNDDRSAILIRNSWGSNWGAEGHLWIHSEVLQVATGAWVIDDTTVQSAALGTTKNEEILE